MTIQQPPPAVEGPPVVMDPTVLRVLVDLIDIAKRQRAAIELLEQRLAAVEHGLCLIEAELERLVSR